MCEWDLASYSEWRRLIDEGEGERMGIEVSFLHSWRAREAVIVY